MTIYEQIVKAMQDEDTDHISIIFTDHGVNVYTSLDQDEMMDFFTEIVMLEKTLSQVH